MNSPIRPTRSSGPLPATRARASRLHTARRPRRRSGTAVGIILPPCTMAHGARPRSTWMANGSSVRLRAPRGSHSHPHSHPHRAWHDVGTECPQVHLPLACQLHAPPLVHPRLHLAKGPLSNSIAASGLPVRLDIVEVTSMSRRGCVVPIVALSMLLVLTAIRRLTYVDLSVLPVSSPRWRSSCGVIPLPY